MARLPVYTIPAGHAFADRLAAGIMAECGVPLADQMTGHNASSNIQQGIQGIHPAAPPATDQTAPFDPMALAAIRIFLPTRRACRVLRESFLRLAGGRPLLLPRMQAIGDVHDDEPALLDLAGLPPDTIAATPPAIPPLRRQMLLARLIMAAPELGAPQPEAALALAAALARLLDTVHTENVPITSLQHLVAGDEIHWQVTVKFLKILSGVWPDLLQSEGMIDPADRRNRLMTTLARAWEAAPPQERIIAAGTTGSIPATAELLRVIAHLPHGAVVLPALDRAMDDAAWDAVADGHPQATLRRLLQHIGVERQDVMDWPAAPADKNAAANSAAINTPESADPLALRRWLAREMMRPAQTTEQWQNLHLRPSDRAALQTDLAQHVDLYEAETAQDEARLIAAIIRHTIETPRKTVAVITPDRRLARRVAAICRRWDIAVDDSAGNSINDTDAGIFLRLVMQAALGPLKPAALLALLRHPLCVAGGAQNTALIDALETLVLRGALPAAGFGGLRNHIAAARAAHKNVPPALDHLLNGLEDALAPFIDMLHNNPQHNSTADPLAAHPIPALAAAHIRAAEALAQYDDGLDDNTLNQEILAPSGASRLWAGDHGAAAAGLYADLLTHGAIMPPLNGEQYAQMAEQMMGAANARTAAGLHPRIYILGQLEARLVQADITILAGLNEGTWPPEPAPDPFLSRKMKQQAGLPVPERSLGLAAHDFVQGFCSPRVIITRAARIDGAQVVPARWLQRLGAVMAAAQIPHELLTTPAAGTPPYQLLARAIDINPQQNPASRPAPCPPVALRPRQLSVTAIETWLRDPYAIYAQRILRLRKLDDLEQPPDAAARGTLLHDALSDFVAEYKDNLPENAARILYDIGLRKIMARSDEAGFWEFWLPRLESLCHWFADEEAKWRSRGWRPFALECSGGMEIPAPYAPFTLTVRADRIDRQTDGTDEMAIIDYKSGGAQKYTPNKIANGHLPQLPLTAAVLQAGGIKDLPTGPNLHIGAASYLGYWVLTGATPAGAIKSLEKDIDTTTARAATGLADLIAIFDQPDTPYYALPRPDYAPDYNDYDHLARVQEWTALGDSAEDFDE